MGAQGDASRAVKGPRPLHGLVIVGASLSIWWPAFTLGAWGELFFDQILMVWVAATAAFFVVAFQPKPFRHRVWRLIALAVPSLWLVLSFLDDSGDNAVIRFLDLLGIAVALVGMPLTLWVLAGIFWPDLGAGLSRRAASIGIMALVVIAIASFVLGLNQARFLTCEDFALSGNSNPPGCVHATPASP